MKIVKNNEPVNIQLPNLQIIEDIQLPIYNTNPVKAQELEPFWHVFSVHHKFTVAGNKIVVRLKARAGHRCAESKEVKNLEKRLFNYNHVVYLSSLDDLYYYDLSSLRYKKRDIPRLIKIFNIIGINATDYLNKAYY